MCRYSLNGISVAIQLAQSEVRAFDEYLVGYGQAKVVVMEHQFVGGPGWNNREWRFLTHQGRLVMVL